MPAKAEMPKGLAYLRAQLRGVNSDLRAAVKANSWQAAAALRRLALQIKAALEESEAAARAASDDLDDAQLLEHFESEAQHMPDAHLEPFVRAYVDRHGLDWPRRVHAGGTSS